MVAIKDHNSLGELNKNYNYNGIDIVKFICSILVVLIHIPLVSAPMGEELSVFESHIVFWTKNYICRIAVPFFFVSSGFFLFKKIPVDQLNTERIKTYCFKLVRLLGVWTIVLSATGVFHLWYLGATVVAIVFISICLHVHIKKSHLFVLVCLLYILGLLGDSYFGLLERFVGDEIINSAYETWTSLFGVSRNGLFMGTIFVMIGMLFAQGYIKIKPLVSLCGFVVSLLCLFCEVRLLNNYDIAMDYNMSVFLVSTVLFLFSFASSLRLKDRPIYARLRTVGVLIYFLHLLVSEFVILGIDVIHEFLRVDLMPLTCLITLVVTVCISVVLEKLSHKEKCSWIKWFLS